MRKLSLFLLTLCHFLVDTYATLLTPVLPLVIARLGLSYAAAGVLGTVMSFASLSQPVMGLLADRMRRRYLVVGGVALAAISAPLLGVAPSYEAIIVVLILGGVGVAAFHPQAFSLAGELSGPRRTFGLALFIFGGTLALGITPIWLTRFATHVGLRWLPLVTLPGLLVVLLATMRLPLRNPNPRAHDPQAMWQALRQSWRPLALITLIVILRTVTSLSFATFLAVLGQERGLSAEAAGSIPLSLYLISGVVGSLIAGYWADKVNPRPLVWIPLVLSCPLLLGYLHTSGPAALALLALGGGTILSSNSLLVAMAQESSPENGGLASSLPLGFAWGVAGLALPLVGHVADLTSMGRTLEYLSYLPLLTALLALWLPRPHR